MYTGSMIELTHSLFSIISDITRSFFSNFLTTYIESNYTTISFYEQLSNIHNNYALSPQIVY